jgi:hypothetical protein
VEVGAIESHPEYRLTETASDQSELFMPLSDTLTIGGFEDGKLINSFYFYNRCNLPAAFEGGGL